MTFDEKPGLPPDGSTGQYLGWDATGHPYLLWWNYYTERWMGAGKSRSSNVTETLLEPKAGEQRKPVIKWHAGPVERGERE